MENFNYNSYEVIRDLDTKIHELGMDEKFKDNPAFMLSFITDIRSSIIEMASIFKNKLNKNTISVSDNNIMIVSDGYLIRISSPDTTTIHLDYIKRNKEWNKKTVSEKTATIDEFGNMKVTTYESIFDNKGCRNGECIVKSFNSISEYNSYGIEMQRTIFEYPDYLIEHDINHGIKPLKEKDNWIKAKGIKRENVNVASVVIVEDNGNSHSSYVQLSKERGLINLDVDDSLYNDSQVQTFDDMNIDEIINSSYNNPKIREGFKIIAKNCENNNYNSLNNSYVNGDTSKKR